MKNWYPLGLVIGALAAAALACASTDSLPATSEPTPGAPAEEGTGTLGGVDLNLHADDSEGLTDSAYDIYEQLQGGSGGEVDRGVLLDAYQNLADYAHVGGEWRFAGPAPVEGLYEGFGDVPTAGRTNAFAIDPRDSNVVYAAVSLGGIWKTTDGGQSWLSLTDNQVPLNYGGIVIDPQNPDTLFALLGEFDGQIAGDVGYLANGLMRTRDAGKTWELVGAEEFNAATVTAVVFADDGTLYAASGQLGVYAAPPDQAEFGIFGSRDGGDNWDRLISCSDFAVCDPQEMFPNASITAQLGGFMDLDMASDGTLFASVCNVECMGTYLVRSRDGGDSWEVLEYGNVIDDWQSEQEVGVAAADEDGNIPYIDGLELAVAAADPSVVLAGGGIWYVEDDEQKPFSFAMLSMDGGDSWEWLSGLGDYCTVMGASPQCTYNNVVEIDPTDASIMYVAGATLDPDTGEYLRLVQRSADGGDSWNDMTPPGTDTYVHADVHGLTFDPADPEILWVGADGGIFRTTNASDDPPSWEFMSRGIGTLLFVDIGLHPDEPGGIIGGLQDNSCAYTMDGKNWESTTCGGDGAYTAFDPFDPSIAYANTYPDWVFNVNFEGGQGDDWDAWETRTDGLDLENEFWPFRPAFTVDPNNEGVIYIYAWSVYRTEDRGETWDAISDYLVSDDYEYIATLAVGVSDAQVLYAGTTTGLVYVTTDGGGDWLDITDSSFPQRPVRRVAVNPDDADTAYAVFGGFDVQTPDTPGRVFRTTDGGSSWEDISFNLPDAPLTSVVVDARSDYAGVYVGGSLGVWVLQQGAEEWAPYGTGMPFAIVTDLELNPATGTMAAATWGRSTWIISMP